MRANSTSLTQIVGESQPERHHWGIFRRGFLP